MIILVDMKTLSFITKYQKTSQCFGKLVYAIKKLSENHRYFKDKKNSSFLTARVFYYGVRIVHDKTINSSEIS